MCNFSQIGYGLKQLQQYTLVRAASTFSFIPVTIPVSEYESH